MRLIALEELTAPCPPSAVCLGTFDGVHLGHRELLRCTAEAADREGLIPAVYTFDVPPASVLGEGRAAVLTEVQEKAALMAECGIERVVYSRFDWQVAQQSAENFFEQVLCGKLNARHVVIGFHYRFGCRAQGDAALMERLCREKGMGITVVPPVRLESGLLVSSSAIRDSLARGDRSLAEKMLNRPLSPREEALLGG